MLFALNASSAFAGLIYVPAGTLDGSATANGSFVELLSESVAVNGKNGHILVADSGLGLVYDYESLTDLSPSTWDGSGTPTGSFGGGRVAVAAADTSGDVYVLDTTDNVVTKFSQAGTLISSFGDSTPSPDGQLSGTATPAGSFQGPLGIAVDQASGDLYVIDSGHGVVDVFDQSGAYQSQFDGTATSQGFFSASYADGIAVNTANGHVFVSDSQSVKAFEFDATGAFLANWNGNDSPLDPASHTPVGSFGFGYTSVAAANATGQVYVTDTDNRFVNAFDQTGAYLRRLTGIGDPRGVAVEQASGDLYVSDNSSGTVRVFELQNVEPPTLSTNPVSSITDKTAHLSGTINPGAPLGNPSTHDVKWHFECTPECPGLPQDQTIPADSSDHAVSVEAKNLDPNTTYEVTLVASNAGGQATSAPPESFSTDAVAPEIGSNASGASKSKAWLAGFVNPWGSPTTYHFEYGTAGPCSSSNPCASTPDVDAGEGVERTFAKATLNGLEPDTTYDYRLIATSLDGGTTAGPDRTITTSVGLPEGRAYELVSPATGKNGADVSVSPSRTISSVDGNAVIFPSLVSFAGPVGNTVFGNDYLARRTPDGWFTHSITPPQAGEATIYLGTVIASFVQSASPDLSRGVFLANPLPGETSNTRKLNSSLYLRDDLATPGVGSYTLLSDCLAPPAGPCAAPLSQVEWQIAPDSEFAFADASEDFGQVLFQSKQNLVAAAEGELPKLYEWDHGTLRLAGILPDGSPASCGAETCSGPGQGAGTGVTANGGRLFGGWPHRTDTAMSTDGSRVFFITGPDEGGNYVDSGRLFVREDHETTIRIDASERTDCAGDPTCGGDGEPDPLPDPSPTHKAKFGFATPDGSKVAFSTQEQLTDDDRNSGNGLDGYDVYLSDLDAPVGHRLTLVSQGTNGAPGTERDKIDVAGISTDGSYVYFEGGQQLVAGQPSLTLKNTNFTTGLFVWHQGTVRYVGDITSPGADDEGVSYTRGSRTVSGRVSADGKTFSFVAGAEGGPSEMNLTGYDNSVSGAGPCKTKRYFTSNTCQQVYAYDAEADKLTCASCLPSGSRPSGDAHIMPRATPIIEGIHLNRALSEDGKHLFFTSPDPLVPTDTNGRYDAYQYDVQTGQVDLLSTGQCGCDSFFVEASPDGKDAFFVTGERLVGIDTDNQADLYDARVGGGIAAQRGQALFECQGDACLPAPSPPNDPTPASSAFNGAGNTSSREARGRKCGKATRKVRRSGKTRCVAKKRTEKTRKRGGK